MRDLWRNYFVLGLSGSRDNLVNNSERMMKLARSVLGKRASEKIKRSSFYGQSLTDQDGRELVPVMGNLPSFDVNGVESEAQAYMEKNQDQFDYSTRVENTSPLRRYPLPADFADQDKYSPPARNYLYHGQPRCEKNLEISIKPQVRVKSTPAQRPTKTSDEKHHERDPLDTSFNDTAKAYKSKTMRDLLRNYFVLGLCSREFLVKNNDRIMKLSRSILGKRAFEQIMRSTFYGQFVAGEDEREIVPVIKHLSSFGVKAILDYSAEEDVKESEVQEDARAYVEKNRDEFEYLSQVDNDSPLRRYQQSADFADRRKYLPAARTYFYHGESQCEKNLEIFFKAIEAVAETTGNTGFAAIKLTALGRPRLLMKLSKIIDYMRQVEGYTRAETLTGLLERFNSLGQAHISPLDEDEEEMLFNLMRRVNRIAAYASQIGGARCMIDAEQTYMQPAINMIAMELMSRYNKREAIIFNTYQCYLKGAHNQVRHDLAVSRRENFFFGAKLVRGAYMDQERARAAKLGYEDPINESFEATSLMYNKTLSYLMEEIERELSIASVAGEQDGDIEAETGKRIGIMVASHNEDSIRFALEQMQRRGIKPHHRVICFGQLYGMCDHVSFTLGQSGYSVYKYTPYGPIEEVLPYLGRRAMENHGFLSKLQRERSLLSQEIMKRLFSMRLFYKPVGNYKTA